MTRDADRALALRKLQALVCVDLVERGQWAFLIHEGEPVAWERTGGFKGRRYTPTKTKHGERDLAMCLRTAVTDRPWYSNVAIVAIFFVSTRQRKDLDNCLKLVMDAGNQANVWRDDCQVTAQAAFLELDAAHPRTVIALCPVSSSLDRTVPMKARRTSLPLDAGAMATRF